MTDKLTKKQMTIRKNTLAMQIRNIRADYSGVLVEDIPVEVAEEVTALMTEMKNLRELLGKG